MEYNVIFLLRCV